MSAYDLQQVRADLDTIRNAAGISAKPVRHDLVGNALIAISGLIAAGWAILSQGVTQLWGLAVVLLPVGYLISLRLRHSRARGGSPQVRQDFATAGAVLSLGVPFVAYALWAERMKIPPMLVLATSIFFVGLLMLSGVLARPRRLELAPWCLAFMVGALLVPSTTLSPVAVIGLMLAAGGFASACVVTVQLRKGDPHAIAG